MVDSGVIMININDSFQDGVCVGVVPLLIVEMQKAGFFYLGKTVWVKKTTNLKETISRGLPMDMKIYWFSPKPRTITTNS